MRAIFLAAVLSLGVGAACSKPEQPAATEQESRRRRLTVEEIEAKLPRLTVDDVEAKLAAGECVVVDANTEMTRKRMGTLPGAVLLSDEETFSISELPADKQKALVFYCRNKHCTASHEAAAKAVSAGYTNVSLMPEGIAGWFKAGKKVQTL